MASTAAQLAALGNDSQWQFRVRALLLQQAAVVWAEAPQTPDTRRAFAKKLIQQNDIALRLAVFLANRGNIIAQTTSYDFTSGHVVTDATDAQIASQINTDWLMMAESV